MRPPETPGPGTLALFALLLMALLAALLAPPDCEAAVRGSAEAGGSATCYVSQFSSRSPTALGLDGKPDLAQPVPVRYGVGAGYSSATNCHPDGGVQINSRTRLVQRPGWHYLRTERQAYADHDNAVVTSAAPLEPLTARSRITLRLRRGERWRNVTGACEADGRALTCKFKHRF